MEGNKPVLSNIDEIPNAELSDINEIPSATQEVAKKKSVRITIEFGWFYVAINGKSIGIRSPIYFK